MKLTLLETTYVPTWVYTRQQQKLLKLEKITWKRNMPLTLPDIYDKLKRMDEVTLLELLNIHSSDIVDRFHDFIEDRADYLEENIDDN